MALTSFIAGTVAESAKVNTNFAHNLTYSSTSTLSYTPSAATTKNFIITKGYVSNTTEIALNATLSLSSNVDGTLDTTIVFEKGNTTENRRQSFCLTYAGTLTSGTHTLTVATSSGDLNVVKITALEFL